MPVLFQNYGQVAEFGRIRSPQNFQSNFVTNMQKQNAKTLNKKQKQQVKDMMLSNTELKYMMFYVNAAGPNATAVVTPSTTIPQGDAQGERIGDSLRFHHAILRGNVTCADSTNVVRVIFFLWRPNSALAAPVAADLLDLGPAGIIDVLSQHNYLKRDLYKIIFDKVYDLTLSGYNRVIDFNEKIQIKGRSDYGTSAGGNATNTIYVLYLSDSAAAPNPTLNLNLQTFYSD